MYNSYTIIILNILLALTFNNKAVRCLKYIENIFNLVLGKLFESKEVDNAFNDINYRDNRNVI